MCGIFGSFSSCESVEVKKVVAGLVSLKNRGPEDDGLVFFNQGEGQCLIKTISGLEELWKSRVGNFIAHTRLSIIDVTARGHQPFSLEHKGETYWIAFNGEIYNYLELKEELLKMGCEFSTESDTEVLLWCYVKWGVECLNKLNGMFSFAVYEKNKNKIFLCRDRLGKKPLYYSISKNRISFASEIKALLLSGLAAGGLNKKFVTHYILLNIFFPNPEETFYADIKNLPGGHYLVYEDGKITTERWWNPDKILHSYIPADDSLKVRLNYLLNDSVRLRLRSDVPVGMCLSGGIDSSGILKVLVDYLEQKHINNEIHVFTGVRPGEENNEEANAKKVVEFTKKTNINIKHHFINLKQINKGELLDFAYYHDEPVRGMSVFSQYLVMKKINDSGIKVVLDGQGSDELFWGYPRYYLNLAIADFFEFKILSGILNLKYFYKQKIQNLRGLFLELFYTIFPVVRVWKVVLKNKGWFNVDKNVIKECIKDYRSLYSIKLPLLQKAEITRGHLPSLLRDEDRNSMRFSIETRLSYLDYRLVELAMSIRPELCGGFTKPLVRDLFFGKLPKEIVWQNNKRGFYDNNSLFVADFYDFAAPFIKKAEKIREYINLDEALKKCKEGDSGLLWKLFNISLFLDQESYVDYNKKIINDKLKKYGMPTL